MRCLRCGELKWKLLCSDCCEQMLSLTPTQRILTNGLKVNSFFAYEEIAPLLHTKHTVFGSKIYKLLAKHAFYKFSQTFDFSELILAIPVDDRVDYGYSHTAILAKALKSPTIKPSFGKLRATSFHKYSGKDLNFRKANPRKFKCSIPNGSKVILVDDLITSGQTLLEASQTLEKNGSTALFALTLANANVI